VDKKVNLVWMVMKRAGRKGEGRENPTVGRTGQGGRTVQLDVQVNKRWFERRRCVPFDSHNQRPREGILLLLLVGGNLNQKRLGAGLKGEYKLETLKMRQ